MGGGGAAPALKLSDVFIFTGVSILFASLIMHAWQPEFSIEEGGDVFSNGISLMKDDIIAISVQPINESTIRISVQDDNGETIDSKISTVASGKTMKFTFEADSSGFYTYKIDTRGNEAQLDIDTQRKWLIDYLPFPIGAAILGFGIAQRNSNDEQQ